MSADNRFNEALPEELKAVEIVLRRLTPNGQSVDRDRVMYLAGRASVASRQSSFRIAWPISTAALLLISSVLGGALLNSAFNRQPIGGAENSTGVPNAIAGDWQANKVPGNDLAMNNPSSSSYLQLRNAVLTGGVDSLPSPRGSVQNHDAADMIPNTPQDIRNFGG